MFRLPEPLSGHPGGVGSILSQSPHSGDSKAELLETAVARPKLKRGDHSGNRMRSIPTEAAYGLFAQGQTDGDKVYH